MTPLSGMGVDIIAPSLTHLTKYFDTTKVSTEMIISIYIFGYGIGQIVTGVLSDVYGRRIIIICSTILFFIISLIITLAQHIETMLALRLLQGFFVAGTAAISRAIVTESFSDNYRKKLANYLVIAWGAGPIIAPIIGGYLQFYFDWTYSLFFLSLYAFLVIVLVVFYLLETNLNKSPRVIDSIKDVIYISRDRQFILSAICAGMCLSNLYVFNVFSPYLVLELFKYDVIYLSNIMLIVGSAWLLGSFFNRFFLSSYESHRVVSFAILSSFLLYVIYTILTYLLDENIIVFIIFSFSNIFISNIIFTRFFADCLSLYPNKAGVAGALTGTFFILVGGGVTLVASLMGVSEIKEVLLTFLFTNVVIFVCFRLSLGKFILKLN
jgi:MFS family permease